MDQIELGVEPRQKASKNANRRLRRSGKLPVVIYGAGKDSAPGQVDAESFGRVLHHVHRSTIFNLKIDGAGEADMAIIRDVQRDPVTDGVIHIDFLRVQTDKPIHVEVPIHVLGIPIGVKLGGRLEIILRTVEVKCLPLEVPDSLDVDVSELNIGRTLHVSDLTVPQGVELITALGDALLSVVAPRAADEPVAPGVAAEGAPEAEKKEGE
jgi:large subunit ribosomal protein L25